ncbi:hypothetical protein HY571_00475 [Candidatus Micrarchaeota archaeon]|nr:hypothetical protein [Candidatus Micrarchaeota archaeon]
MAEITAEQIISKYKLDQRRWTPKATQVFKDGDLIEVDANNGVARKVKVEC